MTQKELKLKELIRTLAAEFFSKESNRQSLITVTGVELRSRGTMAVILVTILPEDKEQSAVAFLHRQLGDLREYVMSRTKLMRVPYFEIAIDKGEKNRQRLEEIPRNS